MFNVQIKECPFYTVHCDHPTAWRPILEAWRHQPGVMEAYSVVVWAQLGALIRVRTSPKVMTIFMNNFKSIFYVLLLYNLTVSAKWTYTTPKKVT
jgi:hypothetical protein